MPRQLCCEVRRRRFTGSKVREVPSSTHELNRVTARTDPAKDELVRISCCHAIRFLCQEIAKTVHLLVPKSDQPLSCSVILDATTLDRHLEAMAAPTKPSASMTYREQACSRCWRHLGGEGKPNHLRSYEKCKSISHPFSKRLHL
jgi:hypothetical protein